MCTVSHQFLDGVLAFKWRLVREDTEKGAAEAVNVSSRIDTVDVLSLFWRHVIERTDDLVVLGQAFAAFGRALVRVEGDQPHIQHLDDALLVYQQVVRLDVPMNDTLLVGVGQSAGGLDGVIHSGGNIECPLLLDQLPEVLAIHEFHHQVKKSAILVGVKGGHNVGMDQPCCCFDLSLKSTQPDLGAGHFFGQDLDCHDPLHAAVPGHENFAHAPATDLLDQVVVPQQ